MEFLVHFRFRVNLFSISLDIQALSDILVWGYLLRIFSRERKFLSGDLSPTDDANIGDSIAVEPVLYWGYTLDRKNVVAFPGILFAF